MKCLFQFVGAPGPRGLNRPGKDPVDHFRFKRAETRGVRARPWGAGRALHDPQDRAGGEMGPLSFY